MKSRYLNLILISLVLIFSSNIKAQFDDLYFDANRDFLWQKINSDIQIQENNTPISNFSNNTESSDGYEDYDYSYSHRIRRFHNNGSVSRYNSFDTWFINYDYDPFFDFSPGINIWVSSPFNYYDPWLYTRSWRRSSFYNPWVVNSCFNNWGWNSWPYYQPFWGYSGWHSPSWHTYAYYPNNWNYYPHSWHNWNHHGGWFGGHPGSGGSGNNNLDNNSKYFGSRKGGSLTSSTKGRDGTSKRGGIAEPIDVTIKPTITNFEKEGDRDQNTLIQGNSGTRSFSWRDKKGDFGSSNQNQSNTSSGVKDNNKPIYDRGTSNMQERPARLQQGSPEMESSNSGSSRNSGFRNKSESEQSRPLGGSNDRFQNQERGSRSGFESGSYRSPSENTSSRPSSSMRSGNDNNVGASNGGQRTSSRRGGK